jgi:hypothetical protein
MTTRSMYAEQADAEDAEDGDGRFGGVAVDPQPITLIVKLLVG